MRILRAVASEAHPCGCLFGVYETYDGEIVRVVDAVGEHCPNHRNGQRLDQAQDPTSEPADIFTSHPSA